MKEHICYIDDTIGEVKGRECTCVGNGAPTPGSSRIFSLSTE
jgi:hypothetical protein